MSKVMLIRGVCLKSILFGMVLSYGSAGEAQINGCDYANAYWPNWACSDLNYVLAFEDEFEGDGLDASFWQLQDWGYGSLAGDGTQQHYRLENLEIDNGFARIVAKEETLTLPIRPWEDDALILEDGVANLRTFNYSSSSIWSLNTFYFGKYEIRCRLPAGTGFWPAFWTYDDGISGWNEIDIFEVYGHEIDRYTCNIYHKWLQTEIRSCSYGTDVEGFDDWHIFTCTFEFDRIQWFIDDVLIRTVTRFETVAFNPLDCSDQLPAGTFFTNKAYPLERMQIVFNMAIQSGPNSPTPDTNFPNYYDIDYIRYYKKENCCDQLVINTTEDIGLLEDTRAFNFVCGRTIEFDGNCVIGEDYRLNLKAAEKIVFKPGLHIAEGSNIHLQISPNVCLEDPQISSIKPIVIKKLAGVKMRDDLFIKVSPNPVRNSCKVEVNYTPKIFFNVELRDVYGRIIRSQIMTGTRSIFFDFTGLVSGIYFVSIFDEHELLIGQNKIVKSS